MPTRRCRRRKLLLSAVAEPAQQIAVNADLRTLGRGTDQNHVKFDRRIAVLIFIKV
jgi:hypothetical protein